MAGRPPQPMATPLDPLQASLHWHEIERIDFHASGPGGFWVPVAQCKCGHQSPPEHRAGHLAGAVRARHAGILEQMHAIFDRATETLQPTCSNPAHRYLMDVRDLRNAVEQSLPL